MVAGDPTTIPLPLQLPPLQSRPLPHPSARPMAGGIARFVDATKGDDAGAGTKESPWKTLAHAVPRLEPGNTLYLRGGVYYERPVWSLAAPADKPITIRSFPGELAIIDGGYREFAEAPAQSWQPNPQGVPGEYVSTKTYSELITDTARRGVQVLARTVEDAVPLHGYKFLSDLRSTNEYWNTKGAGIDETWNLYSGPGVWLNPETKQIHIRLAPMTAEQYGNRRIALQSDPRRLPIVVSGPGNALSLEKAANLHVQDLVVRGAALITVNVRGCRDVVLDGVTVYAGTQALNVASTKGLRLMHSVFRGQSAPWSTRASQKYRGNSPYLLACGGGNSDFEFSHCEFTDSHDGLVLGPVVGMKFHHNVVENMNDDGIFVSRLYGVGGPIHIYQNRIAQVLTSFSFAGAATDPLGEGVYIYRNLLDLRQPTLGGPPQSPQDKTLFLRSSRPAGDHGSPKWQPMFVYHNTLLVNDAGWRGYYAAGFGYSFLNTKRRIWNNIVVQEAQLPGLTFDTYGKVAKVEDDFEANNNLLWSLRDGPEYKGDLFAQYRKGDEYQKTVELHAPGWTTGDIFADPLLTNIKPQGGQVDFRPQPKSPALDAGLVLNAQFPDPLRDQDAGKPDIGALPLGAQLPEFGPQKRFQ